MRSNVAGRIMYVIPFSMGPVGGALTKIGVQVDKIRVEKNNEINCS